MAGKDKKTTESDIKTGIEAATRGGVVGIGVFYGENMVMCTVFAYI
jgi:hypothetical protein